MKYIVTDANGLVTDYGVCPAGQAPNGAVDVIELPRQHDGKVYRRNGQFVYSNEQWVVEDYATKRAKAYPSMRDQLDMLWHAMDAGTFPKAEPFYSSIKTVKTNIPKP